MGNPKDLLNTPEGISNFRNTHSIPFDVQVCAPRADDPLDSGSQDGMPFPTIAVVEGGIRFPLNRLLVPFLSLTNLFPTQCSPNLYRIVMGVAALNILLGTELKVFDILSCYMLIPLDSSKSFFYLKSRDCKKLLVHHILDSNKLSKGDFVIVSEKWETLTIWGGVNHIVP